MQAFIRDIAHFASFIVQLLAPLAFLYMPFWLPFVVQ